MFGFHSVEHKVFKQNFLRKVLFQVNFKKIDLKNSEEKIKKVLGEKFPRITNREGSGIQISFDNNQPKFKPVNDNNGLLLKNITGKVVLELSDNSFILSFDSNDDYVSFDNAKAYLMDVIDFLKTNFEIKEINNYSCRKINIIEFQNDVNPNSIVYFLQNNSLVGNIDCFPNMEKINHNLQSVNFSNDEYFLNLKYGMNIPPNVNSKLGQVIIDIDLIRKVNFDVSEFTQIADSINSEMFNVFNWIASDNLKNILNE